MGPARQADERALDAALRALAHRDHSAASLRARLRRAGLPERACDHALAKLARAGYVDDGRFAAARAAQLAERGYGDGWVRADLARQGVEPEVIEAAVAALPPEAERARALATRLGGGLRAARTLSRRGFGDEAVEPIGSAVAPDGGTGVG